MHQLGWETLNTSKVITYFYSNWRSSDEYGSKIRIKCHPPVARKTETLDGEKCVNWDIIDSFGVKSNSQRYFYDGPTADGWSQDHVTLVNPSLFDQKGFLLENGTFVRSEPIGVTWNDSFCRRIESGGPYGCFVQRNIDSFPIENQPYNDCSG